MRVRPGASVKRRFCRRADEGIGPYGEMEWSEFRSPRITNPKPPRFGCERKTEGADMELSRHLRKPGKRNGASFV